MIKNYLLTSIRTLRQNPLYTALSVFGIALTFVFVCFIVLFVTNGKGGFVMPKYTKRTWKVQWIDQGNGQSRGISKEHYETWISKMTTPEFTVVTARTEEVITLDDNTFLLTIIGVSEGYFDNIYRFRYFRGRPINQQEITENIPVTVLDRSAVSLYFGKDEDPIGKIAELNGIQYRVVGVVENITMFNEAMELISGNMWVPLGTAKTLNYSNLNYAIWFTAKNEASVADVQAEFTRVLDETNLAEGSQYSIPAWAKKPLAEESTFLNAANLTLAVLMMMLIPAINILSLNVSRSFERSEEIAVRKTFGAPIRTIFGQLFFENLLITLAGAIIGMCITPALLNAVDQMILNISIIPMSFSMYFDWKTILIVAVPCVLLFSFLSGSIPAYITAKREIVNVLKGESL